MWFWCWWFGQMTLNFRFLWFGLGVVKRKLGVWNAIRAVFIITDIIKFTRVMGTAVAAFRLFVRKVSFIINTLFAPVSHMLYAEASELFKHAVMRYRRRYGILGAHPSVGQRDGSQRVLNWGFREVEGEQCTPILQLPPTWTDRCAVWRLHAKSTWFIFQFDRTLWIRCFICVNVSTYHSELIVTPLSKNYTNKVCLLSQ
jgi:hypothetical protein